MVKYRTQQLDDIFHALSDATRRKMLLLIAKRQCSVSDLAAPFAMSLAAISKHVKVLEKAGLLEREKTGRVHHCQLNTEPLREAANVIQELEQYWQGQFDALTKFLETTRNKSVKSSSRSKRK